MPLRLPKRQFLLTTAGATLGLLLGGVGAWGQGVALKLRVRTGSGQPRAGLAKRLRKLRISRVEDAFKLANRKAEIEVTR